MKLFRFLMLAMMVGLFFACDDTAKSEGEGEGETPKAEEGAVTYTMNPADAQIMWMGTKPDGAHYGSFGLTEGSLFIKGDVIEGGTATIDVASLKVEDEMPAELQEKLAGHLTSEDFFNTAEFPNAKLNITSVEKYAGAGETAPEGLPSALGNMFVSNPTHTINGQFVVKGKANDISFPAMIEMNDGKVKGMAFFTFNRRDYGLRFMSDTEQGVNPDIHVAVSFAAAK